VSEPSKSVGWSSEKIICTECEWCGTTEAVLLAENPFAEWETITGCPECKSIDRFIPACDRDGCWSEVTCGTPTKDGYRHTCSEHKPDNTKP
jgi:hypothetical protein